MLTIWFYASIHHDKIYSSLCAIISRMCFFFKFYVLWIKFLLTRHIWHLMHIDAISKHENSHTLNIKCNFQNAKSHVDQIDWNAFAYFNRYTRGFMIYHDSPIKYQTIWNKCYSHVKPINWWEICADVLQTTHQ